MARKGALIPKPQAPKDPRKSDDSYRVQLWGGPGHGWWVRVYPQIPVWDQDMKFTIKGVEETYRIHLWVDDDKGNHRCCFLHSTTPTPKESE